MVKDENDQLSNTRNDEGTEAQWGRSIFEQFRRSVSVDPQDAGARIRAAKGPGHPRRGRIQLPVRAHQEVDRVHSCP